MTKVLASAMVIAMALALFCGILFYGAVEPDVAAPMSLLALLAALLWGCKLLLSDVATWKSSPMHWPVLAFGAYALIRYFSSPVEYDARLELLSVLLCVVAYFTACQFYRPADRTVLIAALVVLVALESTYAIWQFSTKSDVVLFWPRDEGYRGRGSGTFICPNNFAGFLVLALGVLLARGLLGHRGQGSVESSTVRRLVILYIALMAVVGIAVSLSRTGWLAAVAGLFMLLAWSSWRGRFHWGRIAAVVAMVALLAMAVWKLAPVRVLNTFTTADRQGNTVVGLREWSFNSRVHLWKSTLPLIRESPLVGTGLGSWQWLSQKHKSALVPTFPECPHNEYLNLLSDYGVVGFGLMLWVFVGFFRHAWRIGDERLPSDERSFALGAVAGVTAVLVHAIFDFNLHIAGNALMLAVVMGATAAIEDPARRHPRAPMPAWARLSLGAGLLVVCALLAWQCGKAALGAMHTSRGNEGKGRFIFDPERALRRYARAIAADPGNPVPHWKSADIIRRKAVWRVGEDKKAEREQLARQAVAAFATALRLNPYDVPALLRAASADELAGDDDAALRKYLRAVEVAPSDSITHEKLGQYYRSRGRYDEALKQYQEAQRWFEPNGIPGISESITELQELVKGQP